MFVESRGPGSPSAHDKEQRGAVRVKAFCKIYDQSHVSQGYTVNLSQNGIFVWAKTNIYTHEKHLVFSIEPPVDLAIAPFVVNIQRVWITEHVSDSFDAIGGKILNLDAEMKLKMNELLGFFRMNLS